MTETESPYEWKTKSSSRLLYPEYPDASWMARQIIDARERAVAIGFLCLCAGALIGFIAGALTVSL